VKRRLKALDPARPTTPEGWVELEAREVAENRAAGADDPMWEQPEYDNWRLWVIYQSRQKLMPRRTGYIAMEIPRRIGRDGMPDAYALATRCAVSVRTVRRHLATLEGMGVDFSRLRKWPHPLRDRM
jgi:HTH domain